MDLTFALQGAGTSNHSCEYPLSFKKFLSVTRRVLDVFAKPPNHVKATYKDEEDDQIIIANKNDWKCCSAWLAEQLEVVPQRPHLLVTLSFPNDPQGCLIKNTRTSAKPPNKSSGCCGGTKCGKQQQRKAAKSSACCGGTKCGKQQQRKAAKSPACCGGTKCGRKAKSPSSSACCGGAKGSNQPPISCGGSGSKPCCGGSRCGNQSKPPPGCCGGSRCGNQSKPPPGCCGGVNCGRRNAPKPTGSNTQKGCCSSGQGSNCTKTSVSRDPQSSAVVKPYTGGPHTPNPTLDKYQYSGDALRAVALPLGPLGGGSIAVAGDGGLRQWQVVNSINHLAHVPDSFFAIKTQTKAGTVTSNVLMSDTWYDETKFQPAPYVTDAQVPAGSIALLKELPGIKTLSVTAKYPVVEIAYESKEQPVTLTQSALSPCVPMDTQRSGVPLIFFSFTVTNPTTDAITVSLMGSQQNFVGWDGQSTITNEVENAAYGGNNNSLVVSNGYAMLHLSNSVLESKAPQQGELALGVLTESTDQVSALNQYQMASDLWQQFTTQTHLGGGPTGPSPAGSTWNGALQNTFELAAGATRTVTFFLGWHFPNRYVNWSQKGFGIDDTNSSFWLGNQYVKLWPKLSDVVSYGVSNAEELIALTTKFRDRMFNSSLPWQVIDSAAGRVSVPRSPTCMWLGDGNFYAFEGCSVNAGCCPLNCTHVWNYEQVLSRLWPSLERTMRKNDLTVQISPNNIIPSRITVPLDLKRMWATWPNYTGVDPASTAICVDGEIGTVLKTYREVRHGADAKWFATMWTQCAKIMARWMTEIDKNGDGVIYEVPQPNTYDCSIYSANLFIGSLYMCALRAAEEMAKLQNDPTLAASYHARFLLSQKNYDAKCYTNGKWYTAVPDPNQPVEQLTDSTFIDCMLGQWWAFQLDLGWLLPQEHITSSVQYIFNSNHRDVGQFNANNQAPRKFYDERDAGLYVATWPSSTPPAHPMLYTSEGAWSGLEYTLAGLALLTGQQDIMLHMLTDTRQRQDGTRRSPWNEIECGDHYSRPQSAWALYEFAGGKDWNAVAAQLTFAPLMGATSFSSFFAAGNGWGLYTQTTPSWRVRTPQQGSVQPVEHKAADASSSSSAQVGLTVDFGTVALTSLRLGIAATAVKATVGGKAVTCSISSAAPYTVVTFSPQLTLSANQTLTLALS